jgi:signal transduction histidine kinase
VSRGTYAFAVSLEPLWRATILFRIVALAFAATVVAVNPKAYQDDRLAWVSIGVMAVWTVVTGFAYARPGGRRWWLVITDLVLTAALQYASVFILTEAKLHSSFPTITTVWTVGPVIVAGALGGRIPGLLAGAALSVVNVVTRGFFDADMGRDAVLLLGLGFLIGLVSTTTRKSAEHVSRALRLEAAAAERDRLARSIHDGVLQVLARVSRRGAELGGEDAELGSLAAEQEYALRALVATAPGPDSKADTIDLSMRLTLLARPTVQVSVPAPAVLLPVPVAEEVAAVVGEALSNADRHAGPGARVWVLVEDLGPEISVSVRDDGPGIPPGRLAEAEAQGRLGVAKSMRGRVSALGGAIELKSEPGMGTEWEIRIPRPRA